MYKVTVLTSSRADYSIYRPLLYILKECPEIRLQLIAFGTHTSTEYGHTVNAIRSDGFDIWQELPFVLDSTSPRTIAESMAATIKQFSAIWETLATDLIICLGDRYEMFAAVAASVPFALPVAHIHGGETTLGAMDNIFRHSLTHMANLHFASCHAYCQRIVDLKGNRDNVYNTGALSIDNMQQVPLLTTAQFLDKFGVDLAQKTLLTTFHPETVSYKRNEIYAQELCAALEELAAEFQVLITMPNADTMGNIIRIQLQRLEERSKKRIFIFENLGTVGYLSAMKHCAMLVGNTSSGFVEASYFPKWVVNLGKRQEGRLLTENIRSITVEKEQICRTVRELDALPIPDVQHPYGNGMAAQNMRQHILEFLKTGS